MAVRTIEGKTLLSSHKAPDSSFDIKYTLNLYRGCQHHCIYCDSRSGSRTIGAAVDATPGALAIMGR